MSFKRSLVPTLFALLIFIPFLVYAQKNAAQGTIIAHPDTSCNKFLLDNKESIIKVLGTNAWKSVIISTLEFPHLVLRNASNTEQLELIQHYGNKDFNVSEFRVSYVLKNDTNTKFLKTTIPAFQSGKQIVLGMTPKEVQHLWGMSGDLRKSGSKSILLYVVKNGSYMQRHYKTRYYARYTFIDNKLTEFSYGFDYE